MRVLVDTHVLIFAGLFPERIGRQAAGILAEQSNEVYVSAVSAWEIATKIRLGKLPEAAPLEQDFLNAAQNAGYIFLSISPEHALRAGRMPGIHRDPFDRMLAAQALAEDIPILSRDAELDSFGVRRIW